MHWHTTPGWTKRTYTPRNLLTNTTSPSGKRTSNGGRNAEESWLWTLTARNWHPLRKVLLNLRTFRQLGLWPRNIGRTPWTKRRGRGLMGLSYWLGQQSPSGQNMEGSRGSYAADSLIWCTNLDGSLGSLRLTPWISWQKIS